MDKIKNFCDIIFSEVQFVSKKENDELYSLNFTSKTFDPQEEKISNNSLSFLNGRDQLTCTVVFGNSDPVTLKSSSLDIPNFIEELRSEHEYQEEELIQISFSIIKKNEEGRITIYDLECFEQELVKLNSNQFLTIFNRAFSGRNKIYFEVHNLDQEFNTSSIYFLSLEQVNDVFESEENVREAHIQKLNTVSHFEGSDRLKLSPVDFKIVNENHTYQILCERFNFHSYVLSIIYLFDISSIDNQYLEYKLNGYKSFKGKIDLSRLDLRKISSYFNIFQWVYEGGNLNDKIGLARNILSLHFEDKDKIYLKGNPFQSIQSSYKIYERDNIKQYIELRNKISEQLIDFNNRASKIVENFANGFQKSSLALISFYISTIVIRVLSTGDFINVFTLDAMILSMAFLLGSLIYFFVSRWEIQNQRKRFVQGYRNLKNRYNDLLNPDDIKRILNEDQDYKDDLEYIDKKKTVYSRMWICILAILFSTSLFLYLVYNTYDLMDTELFQVIYRILRKN